MPDRSRRVLFIDTTHTTVGGVGSRQARLAEALPQLGWRATFALTRGSRFHDPGRYRANLPALNSIELDARTGTSEGRRFAIEAVLRDTRPDVVMPGAVHDAWVVAESLKSVLGYRIVYGLPGIDRNSIAFVARHSASIDAAFGVSPMTECLLREYCGVSRERVFLVPTGVRRAEKTAQSASGPIRLLYVGRFDPDKRILDALALLDQLRSRKVSFRMTLVGDGVHARALKESAAANPDDLRVLPPMPPASLYDEIYPEHDVILLFSPSEGLPNALLEGMAHELAPITSDFEGRRELGLLRDGETAFVFRVGDMSRAAELVESMAANPLARAAVGSAARTAVEKERSVERMAVEFVRVLEHAMARPETCRPIAPVPFSGQSRLRALVGPRMAERLRRAFGISFRHSDASEWPLIDDIALADREGEESRLRNAVKRCRASAVLREDE